MRKTLNVSGGDLPDRTQRVRFRQMIPTEG